MRQQASEVAQAETGFELPAAKRQKMTSFEAAELSTHFEMAQEAAAGRVRRRLPCRCTRGRPGSGDSRERDGERGSDGDVRLTHGGVACGRQGAGSVRIASRGWRQPAAAEEPAAMPGPPEPAAATQPAAATEPAAANAINAGASPAKGKNMSSSIELLSDDDDDERLDGGGRQWRQRESEVESMADADVTVVANSASAHELHEDSTTRCKEVLVQLRQMIEGSTDLANDDRRSSWLQEASSLEQKGMPLTTIGVLGGTGVGKSSLLNALLGEASILPTSGSRGCTAAVVELQYNDELQQQAPAGGSSAGGALSPVYHGRVEFICRDWTRSWSRSSPRSARRRRRSTCASRRMRTPSRRISSSRCTAMAASRFPSRRARSTCSAHSRTTRVTKLLTPRMGANRSTRSR